MVGSSFSKVVPGVDCSSLTTLLDIFGSEKYLIMFDQRCLRKALGRASGSMVYGFIRLHLILKEGYTREDQLCAWLEAVEICTMASSFEDRNTDALQIVRTAHEAVSKRRVPFMKEMREVGWVIDDCAIMVGLPDSVIVDVDVHHEDEVQPEENKKTR